VHRQKVRQALRDATPLPRKAYVREAPTKLGPAKPLIDAMLLADLEAPRKQRHTVRRILARLIDEHEINGRPSRTSATTSPVAVPRSSPMWGDCPTTLRLSDP
jgi:hypothetical protein